MSYLIRFQNEFQITIPLALRSVLSFKVGDYLEVLPYADGILVRPAPFANHAHTKPRLMAFLQETRATSRSREAIDSAVAADRAW